MPTVFHAKSESTKSPKAGNLRFNNYDGSSSGTDTEAGEEEDEDTIVRWGWVWYKGEMRRISELQHLEGGKPGTQHKVSRPILTTVL